MRILCTGAAGFVGSHVAEHYARNKENKVCIIDNLSRHRNNLFLFDSYPNVEFWQTDLRDYKTLEMIIKSFSPEIVIHTAGQTAVTTSLTNPSEDFTTNVIGTFNLLECLRKRRFKGVFIFTSTNKVYGNNVNLTPIIKREIRYEFEFIRGIDELTNIDRTQHTPYGVSKLSADLLVQEYIRTYGFKGLVFRMSCIYGTRQWGTEDQGWVAHFIWSVVQNKPITIYGNGKQVRDILYISDLVSLISKGVKLLQNNKKLDIVYNVGGGPNHTISLLELIKLLEELYPYNITIKFKDWRPADQKIYISDISKVSKDLEWKPSIKVKEGVSMLFNWIENHLNL